MKPSEYRNTYIVQQVTPYRVADAASTLDPLPLSGQLDIGRVLWMQCEPGTQGVSITVYAHGLGLLEIDRQLLQAMSRSREASRQRAAQAT